MHWHTYMHTWYTAVRVAGMLPLLMLCDFLFVLHHHIQQQQRPSPAHQHHQHQHPDHRHYHHTASSSFVTRRAAGLPINKSSVGNGAWHTRMMRGGFVIPGLCNSAAGGCLQQHRRQAREPFKGSAAGRCAQKQPIALEGGACFARAVQWGFRLGDLNASLQEVAELSPGRR